MAKRLCTQHHALLTCSGDNNAFYGSALRDLKTVNHRSPGAQNTGNKNTDQADGVSYASNAAGLQLDELANQIELALVRKELFRANSAKVGLRVLLWAPIEVSVSGAVFESGRVFMSNLAETAGSNSNAAIGRFSSSLPYGTRLLQAAVSANCVGGTRWTDAPRRLLLASKNSLTGFTEVIERSVEQLVRKAEFDDMNPYLMPNGAIARYDSDITNFRDLARTVLELVSPIKQF